jgi:hypothetical protein
VSNFAVFGEHEPNTLAQLYDVASRAARAALWPTAIRAMSCPSAEWRPIPIKCRLLPLDKPIGQDY